MCCRTTKNILMTKQKFLCDASDETEESDERKIQIKH